MGTSDLDQLSHIIDLGTVDGDYTDGELIGYGLWITVSSNDPKGVVIAGLLHGDNLAVTFAEGSCSFDATDLSPIAGVVAVVGAITEVGLTVVSDGAFAAAAPVFNAAATEISNYFDGKSSESKYRDVFGADQNGNFQHDEGGIIVCMPEARSTIYSNGQTQPGRHDAGDYGQRGRLVQYTPSLVRDDYNSFFLCRDVQDGTMQGTVKAASGEAALVAFEKSDAFGDNSGVYTLHVVITRSGSNPEQVQQLFTASGVLNG